MRINLVLPITKNVEELKDKLSSSLAELQTRLYRVTEVATISGTTKDGTSGGANTVTAIAHALDAVPTFIHIEPKGNVTWWVTDQERATWTKTRVYVRFSAADVNFSGYVSRLEK